LAAYGGWRLAEGDHSIVLVLLTVYMVYNLVTDYPKMKRAIHPEQNPRP
jgi:hypothetical protein